MGILLTSTASFPVVIIAIEQLWQLAQRNRVTLPPNPQSQNVLELELQPRLFSL